MPNPKLHQVTFTLPDKEYYFLKKWCQIERRSTRSLIAQLVIAWADGRVFVLDKPTYELLFEKVKEKQVYIAKKVARAETLDILFKEGFRATPYEK